MNRDRQNRRGFAAVLYDFPMFFAILATGLVFLMIIGLKGCSKKDANTSSENATTPIVEPSDSNPLPPATDPDTSVETTDSAPIVTESEPDPSVTETPDESDTEPSETEPPATEEPQPEYPEGFTTVDEDYFSDALFIGDSRTDGLNLYCPVGDAKHYSGTSMTIFKIMDASDSAYGYNGIRALLKGMQFGKIYIMFGINEAGYDTDYFANTYQKVIDEIRSYQPDAIIYIQSILYVTQKHEANYPVFSSDGLKEKNARLKAMANDVDIFYLEVNDALNDGTDHLPSDYTGDGVHLKAKYYQLWHDYLLEHAIVNAKHPWPIEED